MPSSQPRSLIPAGIVAIALGLWTGCGGCFGALGAMGPDGEVPDSPMLSSGQMRAMQGFIEAAASYEPINGALGALACLVGTFLVVTGILLVAKAPYHALIGRVAFGAAMAVDAIAMIWSVLWYLLLFAPLKAYVEGILRASPNPPPNLDEALVPATIIGVGLCIVINGGYYVIKLAIEARALWVCSRADQEEDGDDSAVVVEKVGEDGLDWADS